MAEQGLPPIHALQCSRLQDRSSKLADFKFILAQNSGLFGKLWNFGNTLQTLWIPTYLTENLAENLARSGGIGHRYSFLKGTKILTASHWPGITLLSITLSGIMLYRAVLVPYANILHRSITFAGTRCETNIIECNSNPCQHGGTCVDQVNAFTCQCRPGFVGKI